MTAVLSYKNCQISYDPPSIPDINYLWSHVDYDGAPDSKDIRCGFGRTVEDCIRQIDDMDEAGVLKA